MDTPDTPLTDPVSLVRQLDADAIRARLEQMERERSALLVLLRAALRRGGHTGRQRPPAGKAVPA